MKTVFITLMTLCILNSTYAQNSIAKLKYEQAEGAYVAGNYLEAYNHILETEKLTGVNTTTLYLKILIQDKIVNSTKTPDFSMISSLKTNCATYLKENEGSKKVEDKFREIYYISENLKKFPATLQEYNNAMQILKDQNEAEQRRLEEQKLLQEKMVKEEQDRIAAEKLRLELIERKKIGFFAFKFGLASPLNQDTKSNITYSQWTSAVNETPYTVSLKKGKVGLNKGFTFGFNGIGGFNKLNATKDKFGFGLNYDIAATFLSYDLDEIKNYPSNQSWYFSGFDKSAFGIVSFGIGPSTTLRIGDGDLKIDFYFRLDYNIYFGGSYDAYYSGTGSTTASVYREGSNSGISKTLGFNFRNKQFYSGLEFRLGLKDKADYVDDFYYVTEFYYSETQLKSFSLNNGIIMNYLSLTIGAMF